MSCADETAARRLQAAAEEVLNTYSVQAATSPVGPRNTPPGADFVLYLTDLLNGYRLLRTGPVWTVEQQTGDEWEQVGGHFQHQLDAVTYARGRVEMDRRLLTHDDVRAVVREEVGKALPGSFGLEPGDAVFEVPDDLHAAKNRGLQGEAQAADAVSFEGVDDAVPEFPGPNRQVGQRDGVESVLVGGHEAPPSSPPGHSRVGPEPATGEWPPRPITPGALGPCTAAESARYAFALRQLLESLDGEIVVAALVGEGTPDLLNPERQEVDRVRKFLDGRIVMRPEPCDFRGRALTVLNAFMDKLEATAQAHESSPSVVDLGGSTVGDEGSAGDDPQSPAEPRPAIHIEQAFAFHLDELVEKLIRVEVSFGLTPTDEDVAR